MDDYDDSTQPLVDAGAEIFRTAKKYWDIEHNFFDGKQNTSVMYLIWKAR